MTSPREDVGATIRRVADQNDAVRRAARGAAEESARRVDAERDATEGTDVGPDRNE